MQEKSDNQQELHDVKLREAGISYSLSAVLPVLLSLFVLVPAASFAGEGYADQDWYRYLCYLVSQISFAVVAVFYVRRMKKQAGLSVRSTLKDTYRGAKWYYYLLAVLMQFGLLFSLSELNDYFIRFLGLFGYTQSESTLPSLEGWNLLPAILVIAALPAVCEETIFRGILSREMHGAGWGTAATVFIAGAMFSLFHGNPEQTLYQFVCGSCYTLIALRAGSVFPTMLAHFLNNAVILVLTSFGYGTEWTIPSGGYLALVVCSAVCLVASIGFLVLFDRNNAQKGGVKNGKVFFFAAAVGLAVCGFEWIYTLVTGCFSG